MPHTIPGPAMTAFSPSRSAHSMSFLGHTPSPLYQRIAPKALQLRQLGLNVPAISKRLAVTGKTLSKALNWAQFLPQT